MDVRDRLYQTYGEATTAADPTLRRVVSRHFPADKAARILDVGCGHGDLIRIAMKAGYTNIRGVDRSPHQVALAASLPVSLGDAQATLEAESRLDAVVAFDVIEHLTREELLRMVDTVESALVPGGRWIIHCPNAESPFFGRVRYGDLTHEMAFTRASLRQLLGQRFALSFYEDRPVIHGIKSLVRAAIWRVVREGFRVALAAESGDVGGIFSQNLLVVATKH